MIDLHIHSKYSDGVLDIEEIKECAIKKDIKILSITDHDNIESVNYIQRNNLSNNIIFIPGIEMSTESYYFGNKLKIHLLGYNYDHNDIALNKALLSLYTSRYFDNEEYVSKLIKTYCYLDAEMFKNFDYGHYGWINKRILAHISPLISTDKIVEIKAYLANNKPTYAKYNFKIEEAISLIIAAGGYPIIAHPFELKLDNNKLEALLEYLIELGLMGIESYHNGSSKLESTYYHSLALKYDLYESGGSDFHNFENNQSLGCNYSELNSENRLIKKLIKENKIVGDTSER